MTDTYLRGLGFIPTMRDPKSGQTAFAHAWRYQYNHLAADGTRLFIEHPLGIDACRLSALEAPMLAPEVFASVGLHDRTALAAAMMAFYAAHGGMGPVVASVPDPYFGPYRRQL